MSVGRKVFHCVLDDTALTTNISEIKKWTSQGAITLIVPLYTLERLHALKKAGSQLGMNAREAVRFLDRVTSGKHNIDASKIVLQGPMEQFENWEEAEHYFLPEFQEEVESGQTSPPADAGANHMAEVKPAGNETGDQKPTENLNEMSQMLLNKLNFKKEADSISVNSGGTRSFPTSPMSGSSRASPEYSTSQLEDPVSTETGKDEYSKDGDDSKSRFMIPAVPDGIKPLLNAVLWRLHSQPESSAASNNCILVTNDRTNQSWAQKFGITVKTVPQLRTSIIYEEKEFKNHCKYLEKNKAAPEPKSLLSYEDESDDDVLVFVPRGQGKSRPEAPPGRANNNRKPTGGRIASGQTNGGVKPKETSATDPHTEVAAAPIDPDSFSRNIGTPKPQQKVFEATTPSNANRGAANGSASRAGAGRRGGSRGVGGGAFRGGSRGRGKLWVP